MKLTNNSKSDLGIPGHGHLKPGESCNCENWEEISKSKIIQSWVSKGFLLAEEKQKRSSRRIANTPKTEAPRETKSAEQDSES